jgi:uncharacterized membrane protein
MYLQTTFWVVLLTLGAAYLRFLNLGVKSFWGDEAYSIALVQFKWVDFRQTVVGSEANMALYYVLLRFWSQISDTPSFVRALSALAGAATVPAIYFAGKTLFSRRVGIISALLLTVNAFHIYCSQEARSYSLLMLLVTCSSLSFARIVKCGERTSGVWYILTSGAAMYAHFFAALVLVAQVASWILLPHQFRTRIQLRNMVVVAALGFPLLLFIMSQGTYHLFWVRHSTAKDVYHLFTSFSGSGLKFGLFVLAITLASREWWRHQRHDGYLGGWPFVFVALWLLLPVLITLIVSHWIPAFIARYLLVCLPAALLLFGQGLAQVRPNWLAVAVLAVMVCASLIAVRSYYRKPGKEDWKHAISYLAENARSGDEVILENEYCGRPFDYSLRMSGVQLPKMRTQVGVAAGLSSLSAQGHHLWVLSNGPDLPAIPAQTGGVWRLRFERTLRFSDVALQEFEVVSEEQRTGNN